MNTKNEKLSLLIIGKQSWCKDYQHNFSNNQKYKCQYIFDYQEALHRLQHNSYDVLLLQEKYFDYKSINLSQLSYAMSRPSVILCSSYFRYFLYKLWRKYSSWTNKYQISKKLIHIKMINDNNLNNYLYTLLPQHNLIKAVSSEIRSKVKSK